MTIAAGSIEITFIREGERRSSATTVRGDGVTVRIPGAGPISPLPHDLAHCVVERELRLERGFWASVAAGAIFRRMTVVAGRQRPHAAKRSAAIIRANGAFVGQAEVLAGSFVQIVRDELDRDLCVAVRVLTEAQSACPAGVLMVDDGALARVCVALRTAAARWQATQVGGVVVEHWIPRGAARERSRRSA
jgi:hypothetical protein